MGSEARVRQLALLFERAIETRCRVGDRLAGQGNAFSPQSRRGLGHRQARDRLASGGEVGESLVHQGRARQAEVLEAIDSEPDTGPAANRRMTRDRAARLGREAGGTGPPPGTAVGAEALAYGGR